MSKVIKLADKRKVDVTKVRCVCGEDIKPDVIDYQDKLGKNTVQIRAVKCPECSHVEPAAIYDKALEKERQKLITMKSNLIKLIKKNKIQSVEEATKNKEYVKLKREIEYSQTQLSSKIDAMLGEYKYEKSKPDE